MVTVATTNDAEEAEGGRGEKSGSKRRDDCRGMDMLAILHQDCG